MAERDYHSSEPQCGGGIENRVRIVALEERITEHGVILEQLRNRLPVWCSVVMSLLTGLVGYLAGRLV